MKHLLISASISFVFFLLVTACGLPRKSHYDQDAAVVANSALSGIVIQSTDKSYTSTAIYYYDLAAGKISLLIGKMSGDTLLKWLGDKIYLFDRGNGNVNFSTIKPRSGIESRSIEKATPGANHYDPVAAILGPNGELVMAMNAGSSVVISDEKTTSMLKDVDTTIAGQAFRPADLWLDDGKIWVTHQALDASYRASGPGRVYAAKADSGRWSWESTSGFALTITNPVYVAARANHTAIAAGVCYPNMGASCIAGVDSIYMSSGSATHLSAWDPNKWSPNGGFYDDLSDDTLLACVTEVASQKNMLVRYTIANGSVSALFTMSGSGCGGVLADRSSMRVFVGQSLNDGTGSMTILDKDGSILSTSALTSGVSGLTAAYD